MRALFGIALFCLGFSGSAFAMGSMAPRPSTDAGIFPSMSYDYGIDYRCSGENIAYSAASSSDPCYSEAASEYLVRASDPNIVQLAAQITQGRASAGDKIAAIHDWVAKNISYDIPASESTADPKTIFFEQDARVVLSKRVAICEGYSALTSSLLMASGIAAKLVGGTDLDGGATCKHMWNKAQLDTNTWIAIDTTFDSGYAVQKQFVRSFRTSYLDPKPSVFAESHQECNESSGAMDAPELDEPN